MAESDQQERTEEATQQRREEFRRKGQVAQTRELSTVMYLLSAFVIFWLAGSYFFHQIVDLWNFSFDSTLQEVLQGAEIAPVFVFYLKEGLFLMTPIVLVFMVVGVSASLLQVGFLTNEETLKFDLNKLNPLTGVKRVFSLRSLVEGIKSLFKVTMVLLVLYMVLRNDIAVLPSLVNAPVGEVLTYVGGVVLRLLGSIALLMGVVAGLDYFFQRWEMEKKMRMTKQEIKEEHKSREGDPLIKARIRRIQREMATKRMMDAVPTADVIITNPTHISVALKYNPEKYAAPLLVAAGQDHMAFKIRELAKENGVPIVENKPLARTIYKTLKVGQVIPRELFQAVAEVLAYVFRLRRQAKGI